MIGVVPSIEMVIWVAVGGRNSLVGAILGTLIVNFGKDKVSSAFPELWLYMMGAHVRAGGDRAARGPRRAAASLHPRTPRRIAQNHDTRVLVPLPDDSPAEPEN